MVIRRCFSLIFLLLPVLAFGQTAAELEQMIGSDTVTSARAARFILEAAELLQPGLSGADAEKAAYDMAARSGWVKIGADESVSVKDTAFLIMKAFNIRGGVMYSILKNPRYAYREMVYRRLIQGYSDPGIKATGRGLLQILGRTLTFTGESPEGI